MMEKEATMTRREFLREFAVVSSVMLPSFNIFPEFQKKSEGEKETLFKLLIKPMIDEAEKRRQARRLSDKDYLHRVDEELNQGRMNMLLFTSGETYEPPLINEPGHFIASPSIVSLDYVHNTIDIISLTHDLWGPELNRYLDSPTEKNYARRIDRAQVYLQEGGKDPTLARLTFEEATGLSIDFQVHTKSEVIERFITGVLGGEIVLNLPINIGLGAYFYKERKYDENGRDFPAGTNKLNGREVVGFIAAIAKWGPDDPEYSPLMEHNERKALLFNALLNTIRARAFDISFWLRVKNFTDTETDRASGEIYMDFDHRGLFVDTIANILPSISLAYLNKLEDGFPKIGKEEYIVDNCCSKKKGNIMPIHWLDWTAPGEEKITKLKNDGFFDPKLSYEIPYGADPTGDLVDGYWKPVRNYIREALKGS